MAADKPREPRFCVVCGKEFVPRHRLQKSCSQECKLQQDRLMARLRVARRTGRLPLDQRESICLVCGKKFTPKQAHQKTCSPECSKENVRRIRNEASTRYRRKLGIAALGEQTRICGICGKSYIPKKARQVYCSLECKNKARRRNESAFRKRKQEEFAQLQRERDALTVEVAMLREKLSRTTMLGSLLAAQKKEISGLREFLTNTQKELAKLKEQKQKEPRRVVTQKKKYASPQGMRACHDCGKPTTDYRCPECWKKRRQAEESW